MRWMQGLIQKVNINFTDYKMGDNQVYCAHIALVRLINLTHARVRIAVANAETQ